MRTVFLSLCLATLIPLNAFAVNNKESNNAHKNATQKNQTNAIEIILEDHKQIKKTVGELEKSLNSNVSKSRDVFKNLKGMLENHETMEQKAWYPELEKHDQLKSIIDKVKEEEKAAGDELKEIDGITDDKEWVTKVKKLIKDVKNHAKDEETKLFPKVKKTLDKAELEKIGNEIKEYKGEQGR